MPHTLPGVGVLRKFHDGQLVISHKLPATGVLREFTKGSFGGYLLILIREKVVVSCCTNSSYAEMVYSNTNTKQVLPENCV